MSAFSSPLADAGRLLETDRKISEATAINDDLEAQSLERNHELARLDLWIADAQEALEADPPSRFPSRSALAAVADISDPAQTMMLSLLSVLPTGP